MKKRPTPRKKAARRIARKRSGHFDDGFLSHREAAAFLCVSPSWLYNRRDIPAMRYSPRCVRYDREQLRAWARLRLTHTLPERS